MTMKRRSPLFFFLSSTWLILILFCLPSVAFAHGGINDGHPNVAGPLYGWDLIIPIASFVLSVAVGLLCHCWPAGELTTGVKLSLSVGMLSLLVAAFVYNYQPNEIILSAQASTFDHGPSAHEADEGQLLGSDHSVESVYQAGACDPAAPVRAYDIAAINIEMTLNRYLDFDPEGRMYVLEEEVGRARQEEAQNKAARADEAEPAVSPGLQGDAIQPLILRVNQGECLRLTLRNGLADDEPASLHLHGSGLYVADTDLPAIATNPDAMTYPDQTVTYEWSVSEDEPEGTHYFHSHGNDREQTNHGLFGAVIVEPKGSRYLDPLSGQELRSGWAAIIQDQEGSDFREFAVLYH
jgi:FtsP/CotA-like multicopper oxidase with cupredoxin domain